jgi:outer membrane protein assembly factor BamB
VYFGSYGLLAYDFAGREIWKRPLPTPPTDYGTASSPIVSGGLVLLQRDGNNGTSELLAMDGKTGETRWAAARPASRESFSTPMIWEQAGLKEIIVVGNARVVAYDFRDGKERWFAPGISFLPVAVAVAGDGLLFASSSGASSESEPPYIGTREEIFAQFDQNKDGKLTKDEVPEKASFKWRKDVPDGIRGNTIGYHWMLFDFMQGGKDGVFTAEDWKEVEEFTAKNKNTVMAIRPGGSGNAGTTHLQWQAGRGIPDMPSPLHYRGRLHLVMDGGRLTTYNAKTGKIVIDRERLGPSEQFAASPVAAGGHIYAASGSGKVVVFKAADTLEVLAVNDLGAAIAATPAITGGQLYVRTAGHLQAFGE